MSSMRHDQSSAGGIGLDPSIGLRSRGMGLGAFSVVTKKGS